MKSRKQTTGRFETRKELEDYVLYLYHETPAKQAHIAKQCRVSDTTVANILKGQIRPRTQPA